MMHGHATASKQEVRCRARAWKQQLALAPNVCRHINELQLRYSFTRSSIQTGTNGPGLQAAFSQTPGRSETLRGGPCG